MSVDIHHMKLFSSSLPSKSDIKDWNHPIVLLIAMSCDQHHFLGFLVP